MNAGLKTGAIKKTIYKLVIFIVELFFALIVTMPIFVMVMTSLKTPAELSSGKFNLFPEKWMFSNYIEAMRTSSWDRYFYNTALVTFLAVIISLVINSMAGFAFARLRFRGRDTLFLLALVGMMVPIQVTMLPNFITMRYFPLVGGNNIWGQGGTGLVNTYAGLLAPNIAGAFGVFLFRQFFMNYPSSLDDAAKIDGLNRWGMFVKIYIPLSKSVFATLVALKTTATWNEYTWPLIITVNKDMWTVQLALSVFKDEHTTKWHYLMAATTLIMLPLIIIYIFMQKNFVEGIVTTGIKG